MYRYDIRDFRIALRDRAGLVKRRDLHLSGRFKRYSRLEKYAAPCSYTVSHHYSHRCCKSERTRTAYDEHRYASRQREADCLSDQQPHQYRHRSYRDDCRYEYPRYLVCYFCYRRLCRCRIAYHLYYLRKRSVLAYSCSLALQESRLVDRRRGYRIVRSFVHRHALSGQSRFIDRAHPAFHYTVYRYALTRANDEYIAFFYLRCRHRHFLTVS